MLKNYLLVGVGGGLGAMLRYLVYLSFRNTNFPYATLLINIAGSFIIGLVLGLSLKEINFSSNLKLFLATGICGGFTTFSAFSIENVDLLQAGRFNAAFFYIAASVCAGIAAAWLGFKLINT
ncbi:MAG: fluoride efflux transporter CrcB [Ferruginibacter sp.]